MSPEEVVLSWKDPVRQGDGHPSGDIRLAPVGGSPIANTFDCNTGPVACPGTEIGNCTAHSTIICCWAPTALDSYEAR
jgi:hypothetical protein